MRSDRLRLIDILEFSDQIQRFAAEGRPQFDGDKLVQVWMIHHIRMIGEASRRLSEGLRDRHPAVPWRAMIGMRNVLVHRYHDVNLDTVWGVVERHIEPLRRHVADILTQLPEEDPSI